MPRDNESKQICSICFQPYEGFGNSAQPVNGGRCCNKCNDDVVIPAKLRVQRKEKSDGNP